ncbi:bombyxin A-1 homolog isoform X2 [Trichoplusia ni]|nr:bombyxin A-1 homolog isoform X2 [Trichoplusia ni]
MNSHQGIFLAMLCTITLSSAHIGGGTLALQEANQHVYCGRSLARALAFLCYEEKGSGESKRSDSGTMYNSILSPYYKDQGDVYGWSWMAAQKARSMSLPSRGKRFVVNECCDKACSVSELLSYC